MSDYEFEARVPIECVKHVIDIIRSGNMMSRKGELLEHCGAILGELGALLKSFEEDGPDGPFASVALSEDQDITLSLLMEDIEDEIEGEGFKMNPLVVALIVKLIELALKRLVQ